MVKYWLKNRLLISILSSIILALVFIYAFAFIPSNSVKSVCGSSSIYLNSEIDFQIPNPSVAQLYEIEELTFVDKTFGYYLTKANVSGQKTSKINLMLSENINDLDITMFNSKTLVNSIDNAENYVYIDEKAANELNAKLGDTVKISLAGNSYSYKVCAIYSENTLFKEGTAVVEFKGQIKDTYSNNANVNSLSGAFIKANDISATDSYLNSYIPLGRLKDRNQFDSDDEYNTYNNAIISGSYKNEITNFSEKRANSTTELEQAKEKLKIMSIVGAVAIVIVYFLLSLILRARTSEKTFFKSVIKNKKSIKSYRICTLIVDPIVYLVVSIILGLTLNISSMVVPSIIVVIGFVMTSIINILQDKKYAK